MTWLKDLPTPLAIACLTGLAVLELAVTRQSNLAVAVVSGLLGWMSHRAVMAQPSSSPSSQP